MKGHGAGVKKQVMGVKSHVLDSPIVSATTVTIINYVKTLSPAHHTNILLQQIFKARWSKLYSNTNPLHA